MNTLWASLILLGLPLLFTGCGGGGHDSKTTAPQTYSITDLGVLPGDTYSIAAALNSRGAVVGQSQSSGFYRAFLYQNNQLTDLGTLASTGFALAAGINDSGQICGSSGPHASLYQNGTVSDLGLLPGDVISEAYAVSADGTAVGDSVPALSPSPNQIGPGPSHAVLFRGGSVVSLGTLGADTASVALGINSAGQVVGASYILGSQSNFHAFLYRDGSLTALGTLPGDVGSKAVAINTNAEAVGYSTTDAGAGVQGREIFHNRAVQFAGGQVTSLGVLPGDTDSNATALNDAGQIVGNSTNAAVADPTLFSHPFLWQQGQLTDLNTRLPAGSGWVLTDATGINNAGQVCGSGQHNGQTHAFLLTPH